MVAVRHGGGGPSKAVSFEVFGEQLVGALEDDVRVIFGGVLNQDDGAKGADRVKGQGLSMLITTRIAKRSQKQFVAQW